MVTNQHRMLWKQTTIGPSHAQIGLITHLFAWLFQCKLETFCISLFYVNLITLEKGSACLLLRTLSFKRKKVWHPARIYRF